MTPETLRAQLPEAAEVIIPRRVEEVMLGYDCDCGSCTWCLLCMTYGDPMPVPQRKAGKR